MSHLVQQYPSGIRHTWYTKYDNSFYFVGPYCTHTIVPVVDMEDRVVSMSALERSASVPRNLLGKAEVLQEVGRELR